MVIYLEVDMQIPASDSLKHKRMVVNSLKGRLRNRFNISVAEVGGTDTWQRVTLGISAVGADGAALNGVEERILAFIESFGEPVILGHRSEVIN